MPYKDHVAATRRFRSYFGALHALLPGDAIFGTEAAQHNLPGPGMQDLRTMPQYGLIRPGSEFTRCFGETLRKSLETLHPATMDLCAMSHAGAKLEEILPGSICLSVLVRCQCASATMMRAQQIGC